MTRTPNLLLVPTSVLAMLGLLLMAPAASAQPAPRDGPRLAQDDGFEGRRQKKQKRKKKRKKHKRGKLSPEQREQLRAEVERKMSTYITVELASRLGLSDDKALKLSALLRDRQSQRKTRQKAAKAEYKKLQELLEAGAADSEVQTQTTKTMQAARAVHDEGDVLSDAKKFLTVKEQARLVLAFPHVRKEMRHMMRETRRGMREQMREGRRGEGGFGGLDDDF